MKRFLALAALVLGLAACQTEPEGLDVNVGGAMDTTINVSLPETTRANSEVGAIANLDLANSDLTIRYILQVFYGETATPKQYAYSDGTNVAFDVRLVPGRDYKFVVWADIVEGENAGDNHYNTNDLTAITFNGDWNAMDETFDAYTAVYDTAKELDNGYQGSSNINISLTRPFAKLRVITTDMVELGNLGIVPEGVNVKYTVPVYNTFNALAGAVNTNYNVTEKTFSYNLSDTDNVEQYDATSTSKTLFTNYLFGAENGVIKFEMDVTDKTTAKDRIKFNNFSTDIPVQRNYLTTISGNVLTDGNNIEVTVNDAFADADGNEQHIYVYEYNGYINEPLVLSTGAYIFRDVTMNLLSYDNAVIIEENADVTIDVVGKVNLKAVKEAIKVSAGATLTINGQPTRSNVKTGEVVADGGIGGNDEGVTININNIAKLTAKGNGDHAFGIGGLHATVKIDNTNIDYVSGGHVQPLFVKDEKYGKSEPEGGAAIGGEKVVVINNSTITKAEGGSKAAAIGNSYWQSTEVVITDSELRDIFGGNASAAIGGSRYSENISAEAKQVTKVKIENSTINNAVGGQAGAGIGSGYDTHCAANETNSVNEIVIVNSTITAQGGKYAAGIGTGFHAASLTGSIDAKSTINATSGEPFYKGTYTFAQHIGYGVIDFTREGKDLNVTFTVNGETIETPAVYASYNVVYNNEELTAALNATAEGENRIYFGADIEGNVTVDQKKNHNVVIDGCSKKYNGTFYIEGNNLYPSDETVVIKNIAFETSANEADMYFVEGLKAGNSYPHNITIEDCTFNSTIENNHKVAGISFQQFYKLNVVNCKATNLHSLLQVTSCDNNVEVDGAEITNCKNGISFGNTANATIKSSKINVKGYGVRAEGTDAREAKLTVTGCEITAYIPVVVRKLNADNVKKFTLTIGENNTLNADGDYEIALGSNEYEDGVTPVNPVSEYEVIGASNYAVFPAEPVAKVGNTEYTSIDEAIAAWTNNTTLTLLSNVTLTDVIKISSTEMHTLDLGTYTMTAAKYKDAIQIINNGRSSASYALDIKADATNPGGITATGKAVVKTTGKSGVKDRPIIRFYNGVLTGTNVVYHSGSSGTNCPQFWFYGGVFNGTIYANRALFQFYGGTFNGTLQISVDSSAYALISGGKFKHLNNLYGSALNSDKFTIGSAKGVFDRGVYVDDEGYFVVGGPAITDFGDMFAAKATNVSEAGSYLPYSSAASNGLYYTNAAAAIAKHGEANVVLK